MEDLVETVAETPAQEPKRNRGWFGSDDPRINRNGRPRGSSKAAIEAGIPLADRAPYADRLNVLLLRKREVAHRLGHGDAFWVLNLPSDFEIVTCRVDDAHDAVAFVIRSNSFPRIAKGASIPEFRPTFNGLRWRATRDGPGIPAKA